MAARIAKQLGLSTAKVQEALGAVRGSRGARPPQADSASSYSQTTTSS
jgi:hypothetical protein